MSDAFHTLHDHFRCNHLALERLFSRCLELVLRRVRRAEVIPGIHDAVVMLRTHHEYEDELLIPLVRDHNPLLWDEVVEEHQTIANALLSLERASTVGPPDLSDLESPLKTITEVLPNHFRREEGVLTPDFWRMCFEHDEDAARQFGKRTANYNREALKPATRMLPLLLFNLSDDERERFTEKMPSFVVNGLVPYAFRPAWRSRRAFMAHAPPRLTPRTLRRG